MTRPIVVFDMDGVLVDVSDSYRETICRTVEYFTGRRITRELVQEYKNLGGYNNDWKLSQRICTDLGVAVEYEMVVDTFQEIFLGDGKNGLILRERWIARPGLLERLGTRYQLAIFTGRLQSEARLTLDRLSGVEFSPVVGCDDVAEGKPAPDGLLKIREAGVWGAMWYVGDTIDDARCARAAHIPFIGIASPKAPRHSENVRLLAAEGASAVLDDINQLEKVLRI
jgi:HAD superfamily phosphatase